MRYETTIYNSRNLKNRINGNDSKKFGPGSTIVEI